MSNAQALITVTNSNDLKEVRLVAAVNTLAGKLTDATVALDAYLAERAAAELASKVEVGDTVAFTFGRGDTKKDFFGSVLVVVDTPAGKLLKVLAGEGSETKLYDVRAKDAVVQRAEPAQEVQPDLQAGVKVVAGSDAESPVEATAVDVDSLIASL
jgi:hypothetical protein